MDEWRKTLEEASPVELDKAWRSSRARTVLYTEKVFERVADTLGFVVCRELFTVDVAMTRQHQGHKVPLVFVESENVVGTAEHELAKLACLSAPLRVLVTVAEWGQVWAHGGRAECLMKRWQGLVNAFAAAWPRAGAIGFLIGERHLNDLTFYTWLLGAEGEELEQQRMLLRLSLPTDGYGPLEC